MSDDTDDLPALFEGSISNEGSAATMATLTPEPSSATMATLFLYLGGTSHWR